MELCYEITTLTTSKESQNGKRDPTTTIGSGRAAEYIAEKATDKEWSKVDYLLKEFSKNYRDIASVRNHRLAHLYYSHTQQQIRARFPRVLAGYVLNLLKARRNNIFPPDQNPKNKRS